MVDNINQHEEQSPGASSRLTEEDLGEFIAIWAKEFKEVLTPERARQEATRLLELYRLLTQPLPSEKKNQEKGR